MTDVLSLFTKVTADVGVASKTRLSGNDEETGTGSDFANALKGLDGDKGDRRNRQDDDGRVGTNQPAGDGSIAREEGATDVTRTGTGGALRSFAALRNALSDAASSSAEETAADPSIAAGRTDVRKNGAVEKTAAALDTTVTTAADAPVSDDVLTGLAAVADRVRTATARAEGRASQRTIDTGSAAKTTSNEETAETVDLQKTDRRKLTARTVIDKASVEKASDDASAKDTVTQAPDSDAADATVSLNTASATGDLLGLLSAGTQLGATVQKAQGEGIEWRKGAVAGTSTRTLEGTRLQDGAGETDASGTEGATLLSTETQDRVFRLQRGEGRGQSIDLKIGNSDSGQVNVEARTPASGQAETVNVVETRRYLGFNTPTNSTALTAMVAGNEEWAAAMQPASRLANEAQLSSTGQVVNTLKLELNPHGLGTVTASLRLAGDQLSVQLTVHTAAAYRELREDSSSMLESLRAQGFTVDQVTVAMAPSSARDGGDTASQSFQQQQQQNMQQAAGEGGRSGGEQGARRDRQDGADAGQATLTGRGNDTEQNQSGVRGVGGTRPDHVYL